MSTDPDHPRVVADIDHGLPPKSAARCQSYAVTKDQSTPGVGPTLPGERQTGAEPAGPEQPGEQAGEQTGEQQNAQQNAQVTPAAPCEPDTAPRSRGLTALSVLDLPIVRRHHLDAELLLELSGASRLGDLRPSIVVEEPLLADLTLEDPSQFAVRTAETVAIGQELRASLEHGVVLALAEVHPARLGKLEHLIGEGLVHRAGPLGANGLQPIAISPRAVVEAWCAQPGPRREFLRHALAGLDTLTLRSGVVRSLRVAGVSVIERSAVLRFARHPRVIAYAAVLLYSALRALPVTLVPGFVGKLWVLWTIDLVTALPYTWGIIAMVAARTLPMRLLGLVVAVVTFVAPYLYFWSHGKDYPLSVNLVVIGMIVGAIALEGVRWLRDRQVAAGLRAAPDARR